MGDSEDKRRVCEKLDDVLVEFMDCLDRLAELRRRLSREMGEGYMNMAKARYSMGPLSVGCLQYHSVMTPSCLVETTTTDDEVTPGNQETDEVAPDNKVTDEEVTPGNQTTDEVTPGNQTTDKTAQTSDEDKGAAAAVFSHTVFMVHRPSHHHDDDEGKKRKERGRGGGGGGGESQLRRRRPQTGETDPTGDDEEEGEEEEGVEEAKEERGGRKEEEEERNKTVTKNPLNWFGVLVPRALRQSQNHFIKVCEVCAELATQQSRLESLRSKFISLTHQKQQLIP